MRPPERLESPEKNEPIGSPGTDPADQPRLSHHPACGLATPKFATERRRVRMRLRRGLRWHTAGRFRSVRHSPEALPASPRLRRTGCDQDDGGKDVLVRTPKACKPMDGHTASRTISLTSPKWLRSARPTSPQKKAIMDFWNPSRPKHHLTAFPLRTDWSLITSVPGRRRGARIYTW